MTVEGPDQSGRRIIMFAPCENDGGHARYLRNLLAVDAAEHPWIRRTTWISSADVPLTDGEFEHERVLPRLKDKRKFSHLATLAASRHLHWARRELAFVRHVVRARHSVALVHFQDFTPWFARLETLIFHRCGLRVVATVHNRTPHRNLGFPAPLMRAWFRSFYRSCDALIFHSERMRKLADEDGVINGKPIAVAPFGAQQATVDASADGAEHRLDATVVPAFLVFGRLRMNKGILQMIEAAERFPDLPFRFVGLPESPEMEAFRYSPFKALTTGDRPIFDTIAALISHGLFDRFPNQRVATIESGSNWVGDLIAKMEKSYKQNPSAWGANPVEALRNNVWVSPYYEDDIGVLADAIGIDRVLMGSDWPHAEGIAEPAAFIEDLAGFDDVAIRKVMRDNGLALATRRP